MSSGDSTIQLIDAAEIKQEPDIKEEPQPAKPFGHLGELQTLLHINRDTRPPLNCHMQSEDSAEVCANVSINEVKIEVKRECDKKKETERASKERDKNGDVPHANANANDSAYNQIVNDLRNTMKANRTNANGKAWKPHQCEYCEYSAQFKCRLDRHLLKHTGARPFPCERCSKRFTQKHNLQQHMQVHAEEFPFRCAVCSLGFDSKNQKIEHENWCKKIRYECHLCKKIFGSNKSSLIRHLLVHSGEKPFECKECSNQFISKRNLEDHMKLHAGPRPFCCSECRERFADQNERNDHQTKCNRRTYECFDCGKSFGLSKSNLNQHMRTHSGDKPFECNECSKKLSRTAHLSQHMNIHWQSFPWKCSICRQGFLKQNQCKAHQRSCSRRVHVCYVCKKLSASRVQLKDHMRKHTGEKPFRCGICLSQFTVKGILTRHINSIHN